jgi:lipocalin
MQTLSKQKFEEEYTLWISSAAKDIAFTLNQLKPDEIKSIISRSEQYLENPELVFATEGLEPARNLVPPNILLLSTEAVVFSQSIFAPYPGVLDYAVAMNRHYYLGSWYSIITLNTTYVKEASETMLKYALFHELLQKEIYEENLINEGRKFTHEEKRKISDETKKLAIEKSGITREELVKENQLMLKISYHSPLIPKPFAETALYWYMEKNKEDFKQFAEASRNEKEDEIGKKLNSDFKGWLDFSTNTYRAFLNEVKKELNYMDYGYA